MKYLILSFFILTGFVPAQRLKASAGILPGYKSAWNQKESYFQVVPNPGNGLFTVTYKNEQKGSVMLIVSDATGKYVYLKNIRDFNGELKENVDLIGNPRGLYIFEVEGNNFRELKKVVLQ